MPDSYERWYQQQVGKGKLPNENGYYYYVGSEKEEIKGLTVKVTANKKGENVGIEPTLAQRSSRSGNASISRR